MTATTTLAQKITDKILQGRRILPARRSVITEKQLTQDEAKASVERFAELLESLATSRDEMDEKVKLAADSRGLDLADLLIAGQDLPDLSRLSADADASTLRCRTILQVLQRGIAAKRNRAPGAVEACKSGAPGGRGKNRLYSPGLDVGI